MTDWVLRYDEVVHRLAYANGQTMRAIRERDQARRYARALLGLARIVPFWIGVTKGPLREWAIPMMGLALDGRILLDLLPAELRQLVEE